MCAVGLRHRAQGDPGGRPRRLPPGRARGDPAGRRATAGVDLDALDAALAERPGRGLGHVGEQRGRRDPAGGRDRRALPRRRASPSTPTPCRRSARCRSRSRELPCTLLTISGHKIGAPKGIGALIVRDRKAVEAIIHGGGQQFGIRPGTENVAGAVALGRAAAAGRRRAGRPSRAAARRCATSSPSRLRAAVPDLVVNAEERRARAAHPQRRRARGRQRSAADAPRSGGRRRVERVGLLHRRGRAVARAGGHGRAARAGARRHPVQPGAREHAEATSTARPR